MAAPQRTKTLIYSTWRVEKTAHTRGCIQNLNHLCWLVTEPRSPAADMVKVNTCPLMLHYIKIYTNIHVCVCFYRELTSPIIHPARLIDSALALMLLPHQILEMLLFNRVLGSIGLFSSKDCKEAADSWSMDTSSRNLLQTERRENLMKKSYKKLHYGKYRRVYWGITNIAARDALFLFCYSQEQYQITWVPF